MPDSRPLSYTRNGAYDQPPALSPADLRERRQRNRAALSLEARAARLAEARGDRHSFRRLPTPPPPPSRRRRQRSPSDEGDDSVSAFSMAGSRFPDTADGRAMQARLDEAAGPTPKRRKLDVSGSRCSPPVRPAIKYGYFGQVEPGRLQMELVSCDGGEHVDPRNPTQYLGPKNVLRHDKSVYCSERSSVNVILRHADDTPFCLEKLHIVGPEHGFTAPVQEGELFIALTLSDLQPYISPPHPPTRSRLPYGRRPIPRSSFQHQYHHPNNLTLSDALRDSEVSAALHDDDDDNSPDYARYADTLHDVNLRRPRTAYSPYNNNNNNNEDDHCSSSSTTTSSDETPIDDTAPTAVLSDEDAGPEESSSQDVLDFRLQRQRLMRRRHEIDSWDREDRWSGTAGPQYNPDGYRIGTGENSYGLQRLDAMMARSRVASPPPPVPVIPAAYRRQSSAVEGTGTGMGTRIGTGMGEVRHERFRMRAGRNRVTMKFSPGVSGRFVLLRLWAAGEGGQGRRGGDGGGGGGNVDVQSLVFKGYGGGRYFPAREVL